MKSVPFVPGAVSLQISGDESQWTCGYAPQTYIQFASMYILANLAIVAARNMGTIRCRRQRTIGGREVIGELGQ